MAFLLLRGLPDASLVLVDAVDDLCVVISNVQHLGSFVAGHAEVFDQKYQFKSILIRYCVVLALVVVLASFQVVGVGLRVRQVFGQG